VGRLWVLDLAAGADDESPDGRRVLFAHFGKSGTHLQDLARGVDARDVVADHDAKSYSHEVTYAKDQTDGDVLRSTLLDQASRVARRLRKDAMRGRIVQLKLRDRDFHTVTRRRTRSTPTDDAGELHRVACALLDETWDGRPIRLIGVGAGGIVPVEGDTLSLFESETGSVRARKLTETLDGLESRFGRGTIFRAGGMRARSTRDTGSSLSHDEE